MQELRHEALRLLALTDPDQKRDGVMALYQRFMNGQVVVDVNLVLSENHQVIPGRPQRPLLVNPAQVQRRSMHTLEGRAVLIHALAHIEFNAINLALDAVWRFAAMPNQYYADWLQIAKEEAYHFDLLHRHLQALGYYYGDFPAHNSLWEMVQKTIDSPLARMALVPRTMEARGLDALPPILDRLVQVKDQAAVDILEIIYCDEIGHVQIGNRWFNYLCQLEKLDPVATYAELAKKYRAPKIKGPLNIKARKEAGFTDDELLALTETDGS